MMTPKNSLVNKFLRHFSTVWVDDSKRADDGPSKDDCSSSQVVGSLGMIRVKAEEYERRSKNQPEIEDMSPDEIMSLRDADPFSYYSIPSVRRAALVFDDATKPSHRQRCTEPSDAKRRRTVNMRRTCISVEAHPSVILDDLLEEYYGE